MTATTTTTDWSQTVRWIRERDDYGRSIQRLTRGHETLGVVVTIPRRTQAALGYSHFTNDWSAPRNYPMDLRAEGIVVEHQSLRAAKAHLEAIHGKAAYTV